MDAKTTALSFVEAMQKGDADKLQALVHEDATWWIPGELPVSGTWKGHGEIFGKMLATAGEHMEPGSLTLEVTNVLVDGDTVVVEWRAQARSDQGRPYDNRYSMIFETSAGQITAVREYVDTAAARKALFPNS